MNQIGFSALCHAVRRGGLREYAVDSTAINLSRVAEKELDNEDLGDPRLPVSPIAFNASQRAGKVIFSDDNGAGLGIKYSPPPFGNNRIPLAEDNSGDTIFTCPGENPNLAAGYSVGANNYSKPTDFTRLTHALEQVRLHWPQLNESPPEVR